MTENTYSCLTTIGGQDQIPLLVDHHHGKTLYDKDTIIEHLETHYNA